jgi:hypothetical protein
MQMTGSQAFFQLSKTPKKFVDKVSFTFWLHILIRPTTNY